MGFIRKKKIKGKDYAYYVENAWTKEGSRQKKTRYLGKIIEFGLVEPIEIESVKTKDLNQIIEHLIIGEMKQRGFIGEFVLSKDKIEIDLKNRTVLDDKKPCVLKIGDGFFCKDTLKAIFDYVGVYDNQGANLARLLIDLGLNISNDAFFVLFEKSGGSNEESDLIYY